MRNADICAAYTVFAGSVLLWRLYVRRTRSEALTDPVSFSARIIAAYRAIESTEDAAIINDPLAESMAGPSAMQQVYAELDGKQTSDPGRKYSLTRFGMRTRWIDDRILHAVSTNKGAHIRQIVVLGAGMDTRPWRMALPAGINWFEVDMPDVVAAKRRSLAEVNAQTTLTPQPGQHKGFTYEIHTANYTTFAADLQERAWVEQLEGRGWFREVPTLWLAEGLLMYLDQHASEHLLKDMADNSPKGSVLLAQLFLESAKSFNDDRYGNAKSEGLKQLKDTFKSWVPDDYEQYLEGYNWEVQQGLKLKELHQAVAPDLHGDDEFELGDGNAVYVDAVSI